MAFSRDSFFKDALPGIILGVIFRIDEVQKCLFSSCDSYVLKVEKVLLHGAFVIGYASPSIFVWKMFKKLLDNAAYNVVTIFDDHPNVESVIRGVISLLEQYGFTEIWNMVRDGAICMRFNDCEGDFLAQLNNIKIRFCEVRNPFDARRKLTLCEKLFNDAPLWLLVAAMLILMLLANLKPWWFPKFGERNMTVNMPNPPTGSLAPPKKDAGPGGPSVPPDPGNFAGPPSLRHRPYSLSSKRIDELSLEVAADEFPRESDCRICKDRLKENLLKLLRNRCG